MGKVTLHPHRSAVWRCLLSLTLVLVGAGFLHPAPTSAHSALAPGDEGTLYLPIFKLSGPPAQIVFHSNYQDSNDEIYTLQQDGTGLVRLTNTPSNVHDRDPAWNPSHTQIVFVSNRIGGQNEIYTMNTDGSNVQRLTDNNCDDITPSWSRITGRIAWASNCGGADYEIWTMSSIGLDQQQITHNDFINDSRPRWSTTTNEIVYVTGASIAIMNGDGTNPNTRTAGADPDWSPNGQQIVYRCNISGNLEICLIGVAGGLVTQLTQLPSLEFNPAWGPSGQELVLLSNKDDVNYDIYTMTATVNAPLFRIPSTILIPPGTTEGSPDWY